MSTIFTRAKAAKKVIDLMDRECGVPRGKLRCGARLESDLGIVGDDTYALLEAMHQDGTDMARFDCHDRITPEGTPALPMLIWLAVTLALSWVLLAAFPSLPGWAVLSISWVAAFAVMSLVYRLLPLARHEELRVGDLVLSVEAGHWKSPNAGQADAANP